MLTWKGKGKPFSSSATLSENDPEPAPVGDNAHKGTTDSAGAGDLPAESRSRFCDTGHSSGVSRPAVPEERR